MIARKLIKDLVGIARLIPLFTVLFFWAGGAEAWWNHDWSFRKQIVIDAGPKGAALPADINSGLVLVRLHEGVLNFSDANGDGSDIRFVSEDDKTPLNFHIEKFDPVFNLAFVWVQVPSIKAATPQKLWMYYGNPKAGVEGSPKDSYDASQLLVYHFGEKGQAPSDVSAFHQNATSSPAALDESGLIGNSARFDGTKAVALPSSPNLNIPNGAALTWSAWVKPAAPNSAIIFSQRASSGAALVIGLNNGAPYVAISTNGGALQSSPSAKPIADGNWHHLAIVAAKQITLYVDGAPTVTLAQSLPAIDGPAFLGGEALGAGTSVRAGFVGEIDEFQISKAARDPAEIMLAATNQGIADKLVEFGGDEVQSSWSTGYFGVIMKSITVDGWVVIGVLIVMMIISFVVMGTKGRQIGLASTGNRLFQDAFRSKDGDFGALHHALDIGSGDAIGLGEKDYSRLVESPLMKVFSTGVEELHKRLNRERRSARRTRLSEQSIEAIRASLHATLIREIQSLNSRMVLLTIAISGGPFIGLLGTVVGVMITFAAVAAAGEVNVNAIAPGISAALAATVTGLFVAIPALFGYNYLLTRVKECTADMQVFVDAFVTRIAESYNDPDALESMSE